MHNPADISGGRKHLPYLDGWRGMSLLLVLLAHFDDHVFNVGYTGVALFFVLSGLLMSKILFVDKVPIVTFYRNRIARIFPVFYLYIGVIALFISVNHLDIGKDDLLYSGLFLRTYFGHLSIWDENMLPLGHLWSLNIEEHCYLYLSIIGMISMTRSENFARYMVTVSALACIGFFGLYKFHPPASASPFFLRTECAGFGLLSSASLFLWLRHLKLNIPWYVPIVALAVGVVMQGFANHGFMMFIIPPLLFAISVNTLSAAPRLVHALFEMRWLRWLGICSYSIYIWQQVFFYMVQHSDAYIRCAGLVMALATGALSFYFYEKPMRKWIRSLGTTPAQPTLPLVEAVQ